MSMSTTLTNKSVMGRRNNRSTYECVIFSRSLAVAFAIISEVDLENWREISGTPATRKNPLSTKFFAFILAATHCSCKGVLREAYPSYSFHLHHLPLPLSTTYNINMQLCSSTSMIMNILLAPPPPASPSSSSCYW